MGFSPVEMKCDCSSCGDQQQVFVMMDTIEVDLNGGQKKKKLEAFLLDPVKGVMSRTCTTWMALDRSTVDIRDGTVLP